MALNAEGVPNVRELRKESQENTQNSKTGKGAPQETPKSSQSPQQRKPFLTTFQASQKEHNQPMKTVLSPLTPVPGESN